MPDDIVTYIVRLAAYGFGVSMILYFLGQSLRMFAEIIEKTVWR